MAIIELRKYGISAVFLDGYMPAFSELKKIDWDYAAEHKLYKAQWARDHFNRIRKHLEPEAKRQSAIIESAIYAKLQRFTRLGYCPYTNRSERPCEQWFHPSKGADAMKYSFAPLPYISPEEAANIFYADAENDLLNGKGEYACVISVVDRRPEIGCSVFKECNENWMNFLKFEPKRKQDHSNYKTIKQTLMNIFIEHLIMEEHKYFDDRQLQRFFHPEWFH
jgi:hypothetical protein